MIIYNTYFNEEGLLVIDIEVPNEIGYENINISKIAIQDHNNYTIGYPDNPQFELDSTKSYPYKITPAKTVTKILDLQEIFQMSNLKNTGMYFLYIMKEGIPGPNLTCGEDSEYHVVGVYNSNPLYRLALKHVMDANGVCDSNSKQIILDIYWKKLTLESALFNKDFEVAIDLYNTLVYPDVEKGSCISDCNISLNLNSRRTCWR